MVPAWGRHSHGHGEEGVQGLASPLGSLYPHLPKRPIGANSDGGDSLASGTLCFCQ